jgi:hypothetical protein
MQSVGSGCYHEKCGHAGHMAQRRAVTTYSSFLVEGKRGLLGFVLLFLRAESRRRWRSWLVLGLLVASVGGLVLAATAAGRRTDAAFPQFVARHGYDADVYAQRPVPEVERLPGVSSFAVITGPLAGQPTCSCTHPINSSDLSVEFISAAGVSPWKLVAGHLPNPLRPDQVLASFTLAQENGIKVGTIIHIPFFARSQQAALDSGGASPQPDGPSLALRVVGISASEIDFPSGSTPLDELLVTRAFEQTVMPQTADSIGYAIRLRDGVSGLPRFDAEVNALGAPAGVANEDGQVKSIESSIHAQSVGWWLLAVIAAVLGVPVLYQALARQTALESIEYPVLAALGAARRQLALTAMVRNLAVAVLGAAGAVLIAMALSPLAPVGEAHLAETSTGIFFDPVSLPAGALVTVAVVLLVGFWPAVRATRPAPSKYGAAAAPSAVVARLAIAGAPPSTVIGVRHALQRRSEGVSVPVGPAILGAMLAVAVLAATVVFGASLSHLTASPALYGNDFALNFSPGQPDPALLSHLQHDPAISRITQGYAEDVLVNGVPVGAVAGEAVQGPLLISTIAGRLPAGGQVALGETTMRQVGAHVGSEVEITVSSPTGRKRTVPFRVVSQVSLPTLGGGVNLGTGAVFSIRGYQAAVCPPGAGREKCQRDLLRAGSYGVLASVVPSTQGKTAITHYLNAYPSIASPAVAPTSLVNFGEAVNFPVVVGGIVATFGAATLLHLLMASVTRRRREFCLLKVLGFVNRQIMMSVAWQATTVAVVGLIAGIPVGLIAGRVAWLAFAAHLGVVPVAVIPLATIGTLAVGIAAAAILLAIAPAAAARNTKPARLLRAAGQRSRY